MSPGGTIRRVTWQGYRLPFRRAFSNSQTTTLVRDGLIVAVEAGGGTGIGEASFLVSDGASTLAEAAQLARALGGQVVGRRADEAWPMVDSRRYPIGTARTLVCALETAVSDLAAERAGLSLAEWLLPGSTPMMEIAVNGVIQAEPTMAGVAQAVTLVEQGMRCLKLKVGGDPLAAARYVADVREAVGEGIELRADANGAWSPDEARAFFSGCEHVSLALCEEPLRLDTTGHVEALAALRRNVSVPIAVDESCRTAAELEAVLAAAACDALVVKPMISGLRESLAMVARAGEADVPVVVTTTFDAGPGTAMAAQVAALRLPPFVACGLGTLDLLADDLVRERIEIADGMFRLPAGRGLGVTVDEAALARYAAVAGGEVVG